MLDLDAVVCRKVELMVNVVTSWNALWPWIWICLPVDRIAGWGVP